MLREGPGGAVVCVVPPVARAMSHGCGLSEGVRGPQRRGKGHCAPSAGQPPPSPPHDARAGFTVTFTGTPPRGGAPTPASGQAPCPTPFCPQ